MTLISIHLTSLYDTPIDIFVAIAASNRFDNILPHYFLRPILIIDPLASIPFAVNFIPAQKAGRLNTTFQLIHQ